MKAQGEIVVTKNEAGQIVAVTRENDEGQIIKVIATSEVEPSRRMYIPEIGDHIKLAEDWTFKLYGEYRNTSLIEHLGLDLTWKSYDLDFRDVTLPKGTELGVDRVYIRRGNSEFSSITFNLLGKKKPYKKGGGTSPGRVRFWVKLADVNRMMFLPLLENVQLEM